MVKKIVIERIEDVNSGGPTPTIIIACESGHNYTVEDTPSNSSADLKGRYLAVCKGGKKSGMPPLALIEGFDNSGRPAKWTTLRGKPFDVKDVEKISWRCDCPFEVMTEE